MRFRQLLFLALAVPGFASAAAPEVGSGADTAEQRPQVGRVEIRRKGCSPSSERIYFDRRSAVIKPITFVVLDELVRILKQRPDIRRIQIEGHADNTERDGVEVSWQRAVAVTGYLIDHGVERWRLSTVGFGARCPLFRNDTEDSRAANRRVDFVILQQDNVAPSPPACRDPGSDRR